MDHILVITTEPLPVPGGLTTGAGLRAWGLAEGLRSVGFEVTIATPLEGEQALAQSVNPTDDRVKYFRRPELHQLIDQENPDVIVMQHWGLVYALPPLDCALVIDLAGPHLLERLYWGNPDANCDREEKLAALRLADFVVCGGHFQRHYFWPYLRMAGFDLQHDVIPVIPFSVSPEPVTGWRSPEREPTFIYGGAFLAWQNPEMALRWLLDEMDKAGRGKLLFYGGSHPSLDASGGKFIALYQYLNAHPRVEMRGWKPFAELIKDYASEGHVALDLMEWNPERELAYTTRTMVYLQCGLPVIYNNYSELSQLIKDKNCGWYLDPADEVGFRGLVRSILSDPAIATALHENACAAALDQSWDKTIGPLAAFCANPVRRISVLDIGAPDNETNDHDGDGPIETDASAKPEDAQQVLTRSHGSFFHNKGKFLGFLVYIPVWLMARYLQHRFQVKGSSRAQKNQGSAHV